MGWACFPWYIERERERETALSNPNPNRAAIRKACDDAASLRAVAMRILRPARFPGEGVRRLAEGTPQYRYKAALEEGYWRASQIKQMKEELYDLIAEDVANSVASKPDRLLLKRLCTQVEPRPNDPQWHKLTRNKKVLGYCVTTGFVVSSVLAVSGLTSHPKVVNYDGYLVTTESESVPMLQERLPKEAGYQSVATAGGMRKQEKMEKQMR